MATAPVRAPGQDEELPVSRLLESVDDFNDATNREAAAREAVTAAEAELARANARLVEAELEAAAARAFLLKTAGE